MKSILFRSVILLSMILFLVSPVLAFTEGDPLIVGLIAGQNEVAGSIRVWDDDSSLYVSYDTVEPWCLTETHLAVAPSLDDITQANGNPIPGQFPYKNSHKCATSYLYKIPLDNKVCELYIAAHAVVKSPGSKETAWGSGPAFPGKNWATYFTYSPNACNVTPSPTDSETPTSTPPTPTETPSPTDTPPNPTDTVTVTPAPTGTPPVCQPTVVTADFSQIAIGESVEGLGVVAPGLNIDAKGTAVKIVSNEYPTGYISLNGIGNELLATGGGFTDMTTKRNSQPHLYTFTFTPGVSINEFSLHMLDFGDYNPTLNTAHYASITAYDTGEGVVSQEVVQYTTNGPLNSNLYGNLYYTGDATTSPGNLGNWTWSLSGDGIVKVVLQFGAGYDPAVAFDTLSFTIECSTTTSTSSAQLGFRYMPSDLHLR